MSAPAPNVFGACVQSNPDPGTGATGSYGATVTPGNLAYGTAVQVLLTGAWGTAGATTPGYIIEIEIGGVASSGLAKDCLVSIDKDDAGGTVAASASAWLVDLVGSCAPGAVAGGGRIYRIPITVPNGASLFAKAAVNNATVGTVCVSVRIYANPSKPWLLRTGTALVTLGSGGAATCAGVAMASATAEPAYTQVGGALADDACWIEFGICTNDTTMQANVKFVDVALDTGGAKRIAIFNGRTFSTAVETINQSDTGDYCKALAGDTVHARIECVNGTLDAGESVIAYVVTGRYVEPSSSSFTIAGAVTVGGAAVANGKTVDIFALDSDNIAELVASPVTTGGTGAFTADMPEGARTYFASYVDGGTLGRSANGTAESSTFNIAIPGGGGGDATPPTIAIVSPTPGVAPGAPGGFSADWAVARFTPIVIDITDAGAGNRYQSLVCTYAGASNEITVYRRGAFRGEFAALSSSAAITNGVRLTILPANGWPSSDALNDVVFEVDALDAAGNLVA